MSKPVWHRCAGTQFANTDGSWRYMPTLEAYFHYRNVDVSTIKELCKRWQPELVKGFNKQQAHTALADIMESIEELKYYRERFFIPSQNE